MREGSVDYARTYPSCSITPRRTDSGYPSSSGYRTKSLPPRRDDLHPSLLVGKRRCVPRRSASPPSSGRLAPFPSSSFGMEVIPPRRSGFRSIPLLVGIPSSLPPRRSYVLEPSGKIGTRFPQPSLRSGSGKRVPIFPSRFFARM